MVNAATILLAFGLGSIAGAWVALAIISHSGRKEREQRERQAEAFISAMAVVNNARDAEREKRKAPVVGIVRDN